MEFLDALKTGQPFLIDGAMGTMLMDKGLAPGKSPEEWNLSRPLDVLTVHRAYADAGAQLILSNTFGGNALRLHSGDYSLSQLVRAGVALAKQAARQADHPCFAALDMGPLGALLEPYGDLEEEAALQYFIEAAKAGIQAGPDCILIETMGDAREAAAAVRAVKSVSALPVIATLTFDANGRTFMGQSVSDVLELLLPLGIDGIGSNCGLGPDKMAGVSEAFCKLSGLPVFISPNAGLPRMEDGRAVYDLTPEAFADQMMMIRRTGAVALGGCCGTTPSHIRALRDRLSA